MRTGPNRSAQASRGSSCELREAFLSARQRRGSQSEVASHAYSTISVESGSEHPLPARIEPHADLPSQRYRDRVIFAKNRIANTIFCPLEVADCCQTCMIYPRVVILIFPRLNSCFPGSEENATNLFLWLELVTEWVKFSTDP